MHKNHSDIIIIGGGLTGLAIAYYLRDQKLSVNILEARNRLGGRIHTLYKDGSPSIEMGATWIGSQHVFLKRLLKELGIDIFDQVFGEKAVYEPISTSPPQVVTLPPNAAPSFRVKGGTMALISALAAKISPSQIHLNQVVQSISKTEGDIIVQCENQQYIGKKVISTLPPNLLFSKVDFTPKLPSNLKEVAHSTHTWMGESIKIALTYKEPFWRAPNTSGTIVSNVGPIPEMYDHSNFEDSHYALKGFLNGSYFSLTKAGRVEIILKQLYKYYRDTASTFTDYQEMVWRNEPYTFADYKTHILPHQNNGHELFKNALWDNQLFIAGAETANEFPGYMEGAVRSAQEVVKQLGEKV